LGHKETTFRREAWFTGILFLVITSVLFFRPVPFFWFGSASLLVFAIPFRFLAKKPRVWGWAYFQLYMALGAFVGGIYLVFYLL